MLPFSSIDWIVIAIYILLLGLVGWLCSPKKTESARDYFLAGGTVPAWLAAVSVLSTTQSAATFLGGPDYGYKGDLTYLSTILGAFLGFAFVAHVLIPRFYAMRATTVYELLGQRFGERAMKWAGGMFLVGRLLASGARVYLAAIAIAMVMTGMVTSATVMAASALLVIVSLGFTFFGGLKSVIWNDFLQFNVYVVAALAILVYLRLSIPVSNEEILAALSAAPDGMNKLRLFDLSLDLSHPFSLLAVLTGVALLYVANAGLDQDTTQRLLACKDAREGARGLYISAAATLPVIAIFVFIGSLLHIYYGRPDLMQGAGGQAGEAISGEKVNVFMYYILTEVPSGLRGLATIGIVAAAVGTTNSALNSMSSVLIQDFYRPWRERRGQVAEYHFVVAGRAGMALIGLGMFVLSALSYYWQRNTEMGLLEFALQVMVFAYAGLLGVYFTAVFTQRGNSGSVVAALFAGFVTVLLFQPAIAQMLHFPAVLAGLSFPFQLCLGTLVAAIVCAAPAGHKASIKPQFS
ncbi:sodium:solute symporter [Stakelama tenebrarum]|uniref:Sodium:solute symporter n=1 Tax=Stakelama tenebrarum TaxID=2711215 RepID=A0A6G6Y6H9_9SPHN|nr:sodium:solute symporter [Sphingosinithalassobacter tenebrarum]QIG80186.1 sodium:solute symporter [Sphingosinithalassobacter tenebrarum]